MTMLLSIIIPAYNVGKYITQCLESVYNQNITATSYEVIVINDGSTDDTFQLINDFVNKYNPSNFKVITQHNQGLSTSRNKGLKIANGNYIWFVDSDDWIKQNCLKDVLLTLSSTNAEIIALQTNIYFEDNKTTKFVKRNLHTNKFVSGLDVFKKSWKYPYSGAQFHIFNKNFLIKNKILFTPNIYFEDLLFTPQILDIATKVIIYSLPIYNYRLRSNSITTTSISMRKANDFMFIINRLVTLLESQCHNPYIFRKLILSIMTILARQYINHLPEEQSDTIRNFIISNSAIKQVLKETNSLKYKIIYHIILKYPSLCGR